MDLALTEQQRIMIDTARAWLRERWPPTVAGPWLDGDEPLPSALWDEIATLGWLGLGLPEPAGVGGDLLDLVLLQEELGRTLFPSTFASTLLFARLVERVRPKNGPWQDWLRLIAAGAAIGTIALIEEDGRFVTGVPRTRAVQGTRGWCLRGEKWFVRDADASRWLAVLASGDGGAVGWAFVARDAPGVYCTPLRSTGRDRQYRVRFDDTPVVDMVLAREGNKDIIDRVRAEAMVLECAYLVGVAAEAHTMTVRHATERVQFGRPIGTFQAIQHKVADMTTDLESSQLVTRYAATHIDRPRALVEAMYAKLWTSEAVQRVLREAHQIHGGIGYVIEHPLHRYSRRAKTGELMFGAPAELTEALAAALMESDDSCLP